MREHVAIEPDRQRFRQAVDEILSVNFHTFNTKAVHAVLGSNNNFSSSFNRSP